MRKWKNIQEEKDKLERKLEMITIRNAYQGLIEVSKHSKSFEDFIRNLEIFVDRLNEEINK